MSISTDLVSHYDTKQLNQRATALAQALLCPGPLDYHYESGLFIVGDRGCGKTTFIQEYLMPQLKKLENESPIVIYRSLSEGLNKGDSVTSIIREALGIESGTLAEHLAQWIRSSSCDVILILDDIQQSQRTQDGKISLFSLKAARDAVNLNPDISNRFLLIGVGAPLDEIRKLVWCRDAAFYGAALMEF